jgi:hypothetical protein
MSRRGPGGFRATGLLLGLLLLLPGLFCLGQQPGNNSLDDVYTPAKGWPGGSPDGKSVAGNSRLDGGPGQKTQLISWDIGLLPRGILSLGYARQLSSYFGAEAGLGVAFNGDFIASYLPKIYGAGASKVPLYGDSRAVFQNYFSYPVQAIRPYFHLKGHFFLEKDMEDGVYLSLQYRFYQNTMAYGGDFKDNDDNPNFRPRYTLNYHNLNLTFGNRDSRGSAIHDYCIGVGYRAGFFSEIPVEFGTFPSLSGDDQFDNIKSFGKPAGTLSIRRATLVASYILHFSF